METHIHFDSNGSRLLGALHTPDEPAPGRPGLVLLHGWAGYRIGAHQMFVKLAREACERGFACLRFDFRGRGDSEGDAADTTLTTMIADARAAADLLIAETGVDRIAFVGDCSGSEVAIGAAPLVDACSALVLWSAPIVGASREVTDKAKRKHILATYAAKIFRRETWAKLLAGRLQTDMIRRALVRGGKGAGEEGSASDKDIDWLARFTGFPGDVLFIYGGSDPTAQDALTHYEALTERAERAWHSHIVEGANHAFYSVGWEREVIGATLDWLTARASGTGGDDA